MNWTIVAWYASVLGTVSSVLRFLILGPSTFGIVELIVASIPAIVLFLPAIVLMPMASEIENELRARQAISVSDTVGAQMPRRVMRAVLIFILFFIAAELFRKV